MAFLARGFPVWLVPAIAAVAILGAGATPATPQSREPSQCPTRVTSHGDWLSIRGPAFTNAAEETDNTVPQEITSYAVDPTNPSRLAATNGFSIMVTDDGGCTWQRAYTTIDPQDPVPRPVKARLEENSRRIRDLQIPVPGRIVAIEGCSRPVPCEASGEGLSPGILISQDFGRVWSKTAEGLPLHMSSLFLLRFAPSDPSTGYVFVMAPARADLEGDSPLPDPAAPDLYHTSLYVTADAGKTWEPRSSEGDQGGEGPDWGYASLSLSRAFAIDPRDADTIYLGGDRLARSSDGGRSWTTLLSGQEVTSLSIHGLGGASGIAIAGEDFVARSADRGSTFVPMAQAPPGVTSIAYGPTPDDIVVASDATVQAHIGGGRWRQLSDGVANSFEQVIPALVPAPSYFVLGSIDSSSPPFHIERYMGTIGPQIGQFRIPQFIVPTLDQPGTGCAPPAERFPWQDGWDPAPPGDGPIYVTDFTSGATIRYDRFGTGTVVAVAPQYTEGTALDPLGRIATSTRHSDIVARLDPTDCSLITIDPELPKNESPTFDRYGNMFIADTDRARIYEYPWPQYPKQKPRLVVDMPKETGRAHFIEDIRIAPQKSPFAGDLFVLYTESVRQATGSVTRIGQPDRIARYSLTDDGWERQPDFFDLKAVRPDFQSVGMDFGPDGSLFVVDFGHERSGGSRGWVIRVTPEGTIHEVFGVVSEAVGGALVKIGVTPRGYVYVTLAESTDGCGTPAEAARLVRFDPQGRRLVPDFTHIGERRCYVGIAVPFEFALPALPPTAQPSPPPPPSTPTRGAGVPPLPAPPPPPQISSAPAAQTAPNPGLAPAAEPAPAPAKQPQPQPQGQGNPQGALVQQRQEQPQMALVHAAQHLKERAAMEHSMISMQQQRDPLLPVKYGVGAVALSLMLLYGYATAVAHDARNWAGRRSSQGRWRS